MTSGALSSIAGFVVIFGLLALVIWLARRYNDRNGPRP
jgi:hypothetical protein